MLPLSGDVWCASVYQYVMKEKCKNNYQNEAACDALDKLLLLWKKKTGPATSPSNRLPAPSGTSTMSICMPVCRCVLKSAAHLMQDFF
jgi:hypothetical protein